MQLHYKIQGNGQPILLLHGLFGSLDNLGILARQLSHQYQIIQVDIRNHGLSPWSDEMNYSLMANDVIELINALSLDELIVIGHSMGGKIAMKLTELIADKISRVVIMDIAPVSYQHNHIDVFAAINMCIQQQLTDKKQMQKIMENYLPATTVQFLLKSYKEQHWLFNFKAIERNYANISSWQNLSPYFSPILFLKGEYSNYIVEEYQAELQQQFPYATIEVIEQAGHNVHIEKPEQVITSITNFIA